MRRPSPLSLKVKTKIAELYLLPKKDVFSIAKNYNNIWSKIYKKEFHNMLSIKHKTFNILNKYIEINGIGRINPNDMSRYIYAWEDPNKNNKLNDRSYSFFSNQIQNYVVTKQNTKSKDPNKSPIIKRITPVLTPIKRNSNSITNNNILNNKKIIEKISPKSQSNQPVQTDADFSHLLRMMTNGRQARNNNNSINYTLTNNYNSGKNINIISNKELNFDNNYSQDKESSHSLALNFFNKKEKNNNSDEEGKTIIMSKEDGLLPSTLSNIFNENKAKEVKEKMQKSKKKEMFRKLLSFGKKAAEIFTNEKYSVVLVDKKDELTEINNKNFISSKTVIKDNSKFNDCLSIFQNKLFFENIPEISFEEVNGNTRYKSLRKEEVISFSFESLYQNINTITNMKYSKNKILQEKTINFLKKLTKKKNISNSISSKHKKNSFSNSLSDDNKSISLYSLSENNNNQNKSVKKSSKKIDLIKLFSDSSDNEKDSIVKSEQLYNIKKHRQKTRNKDNQNEEKKFIIGNSMISRADLATNGKIHEFQSLEPKKSINLESPKRNSAQKKRISKNVKYNPRFTFKVDTFNENSSNNDKTGYPISKNNRDSVFCKVKKKRMSVQKSNIQFSEYLSNNIGPVKNSKTVKKGFLGIENDVKKRSHLTENKSSIKDRPSKGSLVVPKSGQNLNSIDNNNRIRNSMEYFAKEKKEDCKIQ